MSVLQTDIFVVVFFIYFFKQIVGKSKNFLTLKNKLSFVGPSFLLIIM